MAEFILHFNGSPHRVTAVPEESLLSVLRNHLALTGTKYGCGEGQCGACTVLLDGVAARSCLLPVGAVGSAHITTIEGLEQNGRLSAVQQAFLDEGALQCGTAPPACSSTPLPFSISRPISPMRKSSPR